MKKFIAILLTVVITVGGLTACGSASDSENSSNEVHKVKVGIGNAWSPFCYLNEDGEEDGYEYQVLKAIDELLDDYEFEFEPLDWTNVLVSLDSGKVDIAAHTFTMNEEREEKYGHSEETYYNYQVFLYVAADNDSVNSLQDLAGQPVFAVTGEASTQAVEVYNEAYPDQAVDLQYAGYSTEAVVAAISDGTLSAWFGTTNVLNQLNEAYGNKLKTAGAPILDENSVFLMKKADTELKEAIDGAIKQLRENGTLSELSIQYLGEDFSGAE